MALTKRTAGRCTPLRRQARFPSHTGHIFRLRCIPLGGNGSRR